MINQENWTFCHYNTPKLKAFISLAGELSSANDTIFIYNVTVADLDNREVFQLSYLDESMAIAEINKKYGHWEFKNLTVTSSKSDDGGCGSCSAH